MKDKGLMKHVVPGEYSMHNPLMHVNVILTFDMPLNDGDPQEFFNLHIPISPTEQSAIDFFDKKFFKLIHEKCFELERDPCNLIKIGAESNWGLFKSVTNKETLTDIHHSCKWFFGNRRIDLDAWEKSLAARYGFGKNVDMSWTNLIPTKKPLSPAAIANHSNFEINHEGEI
ncbi:hypothetical protein [Polynucleobacter sp.]|uniref:hypothetical protein n=1 Tax=Polynucleobacter sp. TaxID=2029855 RepID=UPI003F6A5291